MANRGNIEKMEVEITQELLDFVDDLGLRCHIDDAGGQSYLKVYGSYFVDLGDFQFRWRNHRYCAPIMSYCNISSKGTWLCAVVKNFNKLNSDAQRYLISMNG